MTIKMTYTVLIFLRLASLAGFCTGESQKFVLDRCSFTTTQILTFITLRVQGFCGKYHKIITSFRS